MTDSSEVPEPSDLGWWSISGAALMGALKLAHSGMDPDLVYAELYANSEHDRPYAPPDPPPEPS